MQSGSMTFAELNLIERFIPRSPWYSRRYRTTELLLAIELLKMEMKRRQDHEEGIQYEGIGQLYQEEEEEK